MKLHIITIGQPKLEYAKMGWELYTHRLARYHDLRITHLPDKYANNSEHIHTMAGKARIVALVVGAPQMTSVALAESLDKRATMGQELCFIIGGPEGLPKPVIEAADTRLGLSQLTLPHDLAMVVTAEALYRASTITAGHPYHK
ncbi:MAG TPA: 23S rRNA (pseudouridine(1915)-N(3))-methyltransferase RlmH [Candidatus Saccharimonadales bacterium]|nr:23S rRNA (pseudouridine(1915)-N(3))-methyltransferase RlmH [Candidatus Saccharimonadales bacterium]